MTTEELHRFERGRKLQDLIRHYENKLKFIKKRMSSEYPTNFSTINISEDYDNGMRIYVNTKDLDSRLRNKAVCAMLECILRDMKQEFKKL